MTILHLFFTTETPPMAMQKKSCLSTYTYVSEYVDDYYWFDIYEVGLA